MQIHSEISKNSFKQICLLFFPGAIITIPFILLVYLGSSKTNLGGVMTFFDDHNVTIYIVGLILSLIIGLILENIGSMVENCLDELNGMNKEAWKLYLLNKCNEANDKIVFKYIDSVVFRYKMELSLIPTTILFTVEWLFIYLTDDHILTFNMYYIVLSVVIFIFLFTLYQAMLSCRLLDNMRRIVVIDELGQCPLCKSKVPIQGCDFCKSIIDYSDVSVFKLLWTRWFG